jgi:hypothetical protein
VRGEELWDGGRGGGAGGWRDGAAGDEKSEAYLYVTGMAQPTKAAQAQHIIIYL